MTARCPYHYCCTDLKSPHLCTCIDSKKIDLAPFKQSVNCSSLEISIGYNVISHVLTAPCYMHITDDLYLVFITVPHFTNWLTFSQPSNFKQDILRLLLIKCIFPYIILAIWKQRYLQNTHELLMKINA